jgi:putative membrane protein
MTVRDLPTLNAVLNALSAGLLLWGYVLIRSGRREAHRRAMLAAVSCSAVFLVSYLTYHAQVGSVRFTRTGTIRTVYLTILLTHTVLAAAILPLVLVTLRRAWRGDFARHRALARVTLPLWGYVSVTGVVVYWMLYRL